MKQTSLTVIILLCIGLASAQYACNWGFSASIPNCASCTYTGSTFGTQYAGGTGSYSVCTTCSTGFFLQQSACQPCPMGCLSCQSNGACVTCVYGNWLNPVNATCIACPSSLNCQWCTPTQATSTNYQYGQYGANALGTGAPLIGMYPGQVNVQTGAYWSGPFVCTSCFSSLWYVSSTGACVACPSNSQYCVSTGSSTANATSASFNYPASTAALGNGYRPTITVTCAQGYYVASSISCSSCPSNCYACSSSSVCTTGLSTFAAGISTIYAQTSASSPIVTYTTTNPLTTVLLGNAAPGFYVTGTNTIGTCVANCQLCGASTTVCLIAPMACVTGYVAVLVTGACAACTASNCLYCDPVDLTWYTASLSLCYWCAQGYILNPATKTCVACPTNCQLAYGPVFKTPSAVASFNLTCIWSYTLTAPQCVACQQGFTVFNLDFPTNTATQLYAQQAIGGGSCIALPANCQLGYATTSSQTVATCTQCYVGYGMFWNPVTNVTSCNPCPPNCASCDGTGVCTSCVANYTVAPNQCIQCPYNCSVCLNSTICYNNCTKNYLWNSVTGKCLPNGAERIFLAGIALLSVFLYFL